MQRPRPRLRRLQTDLGGIFRLTVSNETGATVVIEDNDERNYLVLESGVTSLEIPDNLSPGVVLNGVNESGGTVNFITEVRWIHRLRRRHSHPQRPTILRDQNRPAQSSPDRRRLTMVIAARYIGALIGSTGTQETVLQQFALEDTSGNGSSGFFRVGLAFEKGDVPTGQLPIARLDDGTPVRTALMETNSWSDGSLRKATMVGEVAGGVSGSVMIEVTAGVGTQGTSGLDAFAYISAETDFKVRVTNHSGSVSGGLPNRTYLLNVALLNASRREIQADTPVCVRVFAWGHPGSEKHLMALHYVDLWLDQSGDVVGVEWTPVMSQHWWVDDPFGDGAAPKEQRIYDAVLVNGANELEGFGGLQHGYYCRWAGLRTADDAEHARRLWINQGTAMPTLKLAYGATSKRRMMRAGYLPPLAEGYSYDSSRFNSFYLPLGEDTGAVVHNHRRAINGTGGYNGRGAISNMDSMTLVEQTAALWRISRVSAQAGLAAHFHVRDHRPVAGDVSFGLIPAPVQQQGAQAYPGLADEIVAVVGASGGLEQDVPDGGLGAFTNWDEAHHVSYSYFMAFVEGEAYLADAVLSAFDTPYRRSFHNEFGSDPFRQFYLVADRRDALAIPDDRYGAVYATALQERNLGWGQFAANRAYQLLPDSDRHRPYLDIMFQNLSDWINDSLAFFPPDHLAKGGWATRLGPAGSPWMNNFGVLAFWDATLLGDDQGWSGFRALAEQNTRLIANMWQHPYSTVTNRDMRFHDNERLQSVDPAESLNLRPAAIVNSIVTCKLVAGLSIRNGDFIYFSLRDDSGNALTLPPEVQTATRYHVVNADIGSSTFQLALTPGGPPITISDSDAWFGVFAADYVDVSPIGTGGAFLPPADSFGQIAYAAIERAYGARSANVSSQLIETARNFYAPRTDLWQGESFATWNYDGDLIR